MRMKSPLMMIFLLVIYKVYYKTGSSGGGTLVNYNGTGAEDSLGNPLPSPITVLPAHDENVDPDLVDFTLHNLSSDLTYFFVVTAFDNDGESDPSDEKNTLGVISITSTKENGSYAVGEEIEITVHFSQAVTLSAEGTLLITLDTGYQIDIDPFTADSVTGSYIVQAGDNSSDLTVTSLASLALDPQTATRNSLVYRQ